MQIKVYVGNLSYDTTEGEIAALFAQAGTVTSVTVIKDRDTGQSKGFAFVEMGSQSEAEQAIRAFDGYVLANRSLRVSLARPKEERSFGGYRREETGRRGRDRRGRGGERRRY